MKDKLPFIVTVPHGGNIVPPEIDKQFLNISEKQMFDDADGFTPLIYKADDIVKYYYASDIYRCFVDMNRTKDDQPPSNPDGVVKTHTCFNIPIYKHNYDFDHHPTGKLLKNYYDPFHKNILETIGNDSSLVMGFDCHSMNSRGPAISKDQGKIRPKICLGNKKGKSCSFEILEICRNSFASAFNLPLGDVALNEPFTGGHIVSTNGNSPLPWIIIEMSKAMYLPEDFEDVRPNVSIKGHINDLNSGFVRALELIYENILTS